MSLFYKDDPEISVYLCDIIIEINNPIKNIKPVIKILGNIDIFLIFNFGFQRQLIS